MKKSFLVIVVLFLNIQLFAQTLLARTWYLDKNNTKLTVNEKWGESSSGLKNGDYIKYFKDGEREIYGHYLNGQENGEWIKTFYYTNSIKTKIVYHYNMGKLHGSWLETSMDGTEVLEKGNYKNGNKHGDWIEFPVGLFSQSGRITGTYVDGKREGEWTNFRGYEHYKWTSNKDYKPYTLTPSEDYSKGYKTFYKDGEIVKVINDKGENEAEECDYKNSSWVLSDESLEFRKKHSYDVASKMCQEFLTKYPNSKYYSEIHAEFNKRQSQKKDKEQKENERALALEKAKKGDVEGIRTYFGENSKMYFLYYVVNHNSKESKVKFKSDWNYSSKLQNDKYLAPIHENESEVFMAILKNATNPQVSESMKMWDESGTSTLGQFEAEWLAKSGTSLKWASKYYGDYHIRLHLLNDELIIKEYGETGLKLFYNNVLVHTTTTDNLYEGYNNLSNEAKYAVIYYDLSFRQNHLELKEFGYLLNHIHELLKNNRPECIELLIKKIEGNDISVEETSYHDAEAIKTVFLSILYWEKGMSDKSIGVLKESTSKYQKYSSLYESWQSCSIGDYVKFFVNHYLNKDSSVELTEEKDYLKLVKKL